MTRYYDYVLGLIPLAMIAVAGTLGLAGYALPVAVSVGAAVAVGVMGHALFVNAPTSPAVPDAPAMASPSSDSVSAADD